MPNSNSPSDLASQPKSAGRRDTLESIERLLDGAEATFVERGYHGANVHEICARADVGIGTFYAHFAHKRDLLQRLFAERVLASPTADDLLDHARLVGQLQRAADDPTTAALLRAWYEALPDEPKLARAHAEWRPKYLIGLAAAIGEARRRVGSTHPRHDAATIAWTMATLSREMAIHDRVGLPDLHTLARLFGQLMFAKRGPDHDNAE